jgi:hypothetical protein
MIVCTSVLSGDPFAYVNELFTIQLRAFLYVHACSYRSMLRRNMQAYRRYNNIYYYKLSPSLLAAIAAWYLSLLYYMSI